VEPTKVSGELMTLYLLVNPNRISACKYLAHICILNSAHYIINLALDSDRLNYDIFILKEISNRLIYIICCKFFKRVDCNVYLTNL